jgi:hypothetical protein
MLANTYNKESVESDKFEVIEEIEPFMVSEIDKDPDRCNNCRLLKQEDKVCSTYRDLRVKFENAGQSLPPEEFYCLFWKCD